MWGKCKALIVYNGKGVSCVRRSLTLATIMLRLMKLKLCCAVVDINYWQNKIKMPKHNQGLAMPLPLWQN